MEFFYILWSQLLQHVEAIKALALIGGGLWALAMFHHNNRMRRAEWLGKLYDQFYQRKEYKKMRRIIDYKKCPEYNELWEHAMLKDSGEGIAERFVDYLNFFELIASLQVAGQIGVKEIKRMFRYYLRLLAADPMTRVLLQKWEFMNLPKLLAADPDFIPHSDYLFVYGTLKHTMNNKEAMQLRADAEYVGKAEIPGRIYRKEAGGLVYPVLVPPAGEGETVKGELFRLPDGKAAREALFSWLDEYEAYDAADYRNSEFIRGIMRVDAGGELVHAWAYLYGTPLKKLTRIRNGIFTR